LSRLTCRKNCAAHVATINLWDELIRIMLLYAGTIFLSAFLLFLVQPVIAKQVLPWFGGAGSVWAICLVFFQTMLLFGYAYADWTTRKLTPRTQAVLHAVLLAVSLLLLPIIPDAQWKPGADTDTSPAWLILGLLGVTIGMQYFLLSSTSPLVQAWYWRRYQRGVPYRLFALSNFASLLALLSYPFLVEPLLPLAAQSVSWSAGYAVFAVVCAVTAVVTAWRSAPPASGPAASQGSDRAPSWGERSLWVALAATGSCVLLAVTNHLTQNIASIPFLWVVPLSLYLITFILCFDHPRWYYRPLFLVLVGVLVPLMAWYSDSLELWVAAPLYAAGLFVCCMFCHGELYRMRPGPAYLTTFYLMIAVGGALGSILIGIAAPSLLSGYYELGITLAACAALLFVRCAMLHVWVRTAAFAIVVLTGGLAVKHAHDYVDEARVVMRNFYGVVRTRDFTDPVHFRAMYHGSINHGGQLLDPALRRHPTTYFGLSSGYGRVFASLPTGPRRVGIIGLGAGAITVYSRPGDLFRFYELDPQVAAVAVREFTFLNDSPGKVEVVLGDGRLSLENEANQGYDLIAVDAFSGGSIPMHLLTYEAMATYIRHLRPGGVIVFQATNRYVNIAPVIARIATELGYEAYLVSDWPDNENSRDADYWLSSTDQVVVTGNRELMASDSLRKAAERLQPPPGFRVWTDDYYNLFSILK